MKRRNFFALLLAPFIAKFLPKPKPGYFNIDEFERKYLAPALQPMIDQMDKPVLDMIVNTTMEWNLATGDYTRKFYREDGSTVTLESYKFQKGCAPFVLNPPANLDWIITYEEMPVNDFHKKYPNGGSKRVYTPGERS